MGGATQSRNVLNDNNLLCPHPRPEAVAHRVRCIAHGARYFEATIIGAVVGCGLPPIGSSVTATAASESFAIG
jgi:hypothetical protein